MSQTRLLLAQGQSVSIVGARRIGKTSLLLQLAAAPDQIGPAARSVYFNCEPWVSASPEALYALLADTLAPSRAAPQTSALSYRDLRAIVLDASADERRIVWLLDEFEALATNPLLDVGFFSGLRALATTGRVAFVTASARSLGWLTFAEPTVLSSPFFNIFTQINLYPFSMSGAAAMLRHLAAQAGVRLSDATVDFVLSLAGPHPFFVQMAAYYAYQRLEQATGELTSDSRTWVRREFLVQVEPHWQYAWREIAPPDRKQVALSPDLATCAPDLLRRLQELALAVATEAGWRLLSPELAAYFARQPIAGLLQAPPLVVDPAQHRVVLDGRELDVHGLEFDLLVLLASQAPDVLTQATLQAALWPQENGRADNVERLKSVVRSLRRKLGSHADLLRNVRGIGYAFAAQRIDVDAA